MSRTKRDRRPVRADSVAVGPRREIPAGYFKCRLHGATLPVEQRQPDLPDAWTCCKACWIKSQDTTDKHRNPLSH